MLIPHPVKFLVEGPGIGDGMGGKGNEPGSLQVGVHLTGHLAGQEGLSDGGTVEGNLLAHLGVHPQGVF